jgi:citrate lyase synthetase
MKLNALTNNTKITVFDERNDLKAVHELINNTIDICYPEFYNEAVVLYFKQYHCAKNIIERAKKGFTIVCRIHEQIIGTGSLIDDYITAVYVTPELQGHHIGQQIMHELFNDAERQSLTALRLDSTPGAKNFYQNLGFKVLSEETQWINDVSPLKYYLMEWRKTIIKA